MLNTPLGDKESQLGSAMELKVATALLFEYWSCCENDRPTAVMLGAGQLIDGAAFTANEQVSDCVDRATSLTNKPNV